MKRAIIPLSANKIARQARVTFRIKWLRQFKVRLTIASVIVKIGLAVLPIPSQLKWQKDGQEQGLLERPEPTDTPPGSRTALEKRPLMEAWLKRLGEGAQKWSNGKCLSGSLYQDNPNICYFLWPQKETSDSEVYINGVLTIQQLEALAVHIKKVNKICTNTQKI